MIPDGNFKCHKKLTSARIVKSVVKYKRLFFIFKNTLKDAYLKQKISTVYMGFMTHLEGKTTIASAQKTGKEKEI